MLGGVACCAGVVGKGSRIEEGDAVGERLEGGGGGEGVAEAEHEGEAAQSGGEFMGGDDAEKLDFLPSGRKGYGRGIRNRKDGTGRDGTGWDGMGRDG